MRRPVGRILLCSMAVPWPEMPRLCAFHHDQAKALAELGTEMRVFSPAPCLPRWLRHVHPRFRRHVERPRTYEMNGVVTESPRCAFAFPPTVRHKIARRWPELVAGYATWSMKRALRDTVGRYQPDVLLGHGAMPWGGLLRQVSKETGIPYSLIEHSAGDVLRLEEGTPLARHYTRIALDAEQVFVVGTWMRMHLQRMGWGNLCQLPNGARMPDAETRGRPRPRDLIDRTIVLSAANYDRRKGFEDLVDAFGRVEAGFPKAMLVLITDAPAQLERKIETAGLGERIRLIPRMSQDALMQWMVWADLFAMPSWSEAFGLVYVEALACGTPVLMTADCGLAPQIGLVVRDPSPDQHGWVVEPRNIGSLERALREGLADRRLLSRMGDSGRRFVLGRFTWPQNAQQMLEALGDPGDAQAPREEMACL